MIFITLALYSRRAIPKMYTSTKVRKHKLIQFVKYIEVTKTNLDEMRSQIFCIYGTQNISIKNMGCFRNKTMQPE